MKIKSSIIRQLSDFSAWRLVSPKGPNFSLLDYISCVGTPDLLFAFSELFCPELVFHEGDYFLEDRFNADVYRSWKNKLTDSVEIQRVMNHVHISTIFQEQDVSNEVAVQAARVIADIWSIVFVDKRLTGYSFGETLEDAGVTLARKT